MTQQANGSGAAFHRKPTFAGVINAEVAGNAEKEFQALRAKRF